MAARTEDERISCYETARRDGVTRPALEDALAGTSGLVGDRAVYAAQARCLATALDIASVRGEPSGCAQAAKELRAVMAALYGDPTAATRPDDPAAAALQEIRGA